MYDNNQNNLISLTAVDGVRAWYGEGMLSEMTALMFLGSFVTVIAFGIRQYAYGVSYHHPLDAL